MAKIYKILNGVHRSVAAFQAGLSEIRSRVDRRGALDPPQLIRLDYLYSPKPEIGRSDRGRDFQVLVDIMKDDIARELLDPIEIAVIPVQIAKYFTPIAAVEVL